MTDSQKLAWQALVEEGHILTMTATEAQEFLRLAAVATGCDPKKSGEFPQCEICPSDLLLQAND